MEVRADSVADLAAEHFNAAKNPIIAGFASSNYGISL